jgi:BirA family biotin operon repressor/biotin-[acetyl-CoA-carboxylase] ligase
MISSESQNNGRGQYGKKWISFKGNLFVSFFFKLDNLKISFKQLTKLNCLLVRKILSTYYKKKIIYKKPNDLLIDKKKICGILQETLIKLDKKYLIVGVGINLIKSPYIKNYPTTNLKELLNKKVSKIKIENQLKKIFELKLTKLYK